MSASDELLFAGVIAGGSVAVLYIAGSSGSGTDAVDFMSATAAGAGVGGMLIPLVRSRAANFSPNGAVLGGLAGFVSVGVLRAVGLI